MRTRSYERQATTGAPIGTKARAPGPVYAGLQCVALTYAMRAIHRLLVDGRVPRRVEQHEMTRPRQRLPLGHPVHEAADTRTALPSHIEESFAFLAQLALDRTCQHHDGVCRAQLLAHVLGDDIERLSSRRHDDDALACGCEDQVEQHPCGLHKGSEGPTSEPKCTRARSRAMPPVHAGASERTWSLPLSTRRDSVRSGSFGTTELNMEAPIDVVEISAGSRCKALKQHKQSSSQCTANPTHHPEPHPTQTLSILTYPNPNPRTRGAHLSMLIRPSTSPSPAPTTLACSARWIAVGRQKTSTSCLSGRPCESASFVRRNIVAVVTCRSSSIWISPNSMSSCAREKKRDGSVAGQDRGLYSGRRSRMVQCARGRRSGRLTSVASGFLAAAIGRTKSSSNSERVPRQPGLARSRTA
jgi:hypothetical protein